MWIVTFKKDYTTIRFEFETSKDAIDFMSIAVCSGKTECEVYMKYERKEGEE